MPGRRRRPRISLCGLVAAALALAGSVASESHADTVTIDFETGPAIDTAINDDYKQSHFTFFQREDPGFRPYRKSVPGLAHSGNVVADISPAHCYPGEVDDAGACEFPVSSTLGRLTRTASSITLYAGLSEPLRQPGRRHAHRSQLAGPDRRPELGGRRGSRLRHTDHCHQRQPGHRQLRAHLRPDTGAALGFDDLTIDFRPGPCPTSHCRPRSTRRSSSRARGATCRSRSPASTAPTARSRCRPPACRPGSRPSSCPTRCPGPDDRGEAVLRATTRRRSSAR